MAHCKKFTKAACGQMFSHYDRRKEHFGNENIDKARIHLNYNLATHQQMEQGDFVRQRCSEVRMQNRKDLNVMCAWVITVPKELHETEHKQFFKESYNFLANRYGENNNISAWVHNDEMTPHLHYAFVPVVEDKKRNGYKVSAKEAITKRDLQTFHKDLEQYLKQKLGHTVGILNEATKNGNKSISDLKKETAQQKVREARVEASRIVSTATLKAQARILR